MQDSNSALAVTELWSLPVELAARAFSAFRLAPEMLAQAINPGWSSVININSNNSAAPETERTVLTRYSYGRQIGRLMDVVTLLIDDLEARKPAVGKEKVVVDYRKLQNDVAGIKAQAAARRVDRIVADIESLRSTDDAEFRQLMERLRKLMGESPGRP